MNFVNHEYDNPELLISSLAKLSRKLAETNVFSQIKVALSLHYVFQHCSDEAKVAWSKAIVSMKNEMDERLGQYFFSIDYLTDALSSAGTVLELEYIELTKNYLLYIINLLEINGRLHDAKNKAEGLSKQKQSRATRKPSKSKVAANDEDASVSSADVTRLRESNAEIINHVQKLEGSLISQLVDLVKADEVLLSKLSKELSASSKISTSSPNASQKPTNKVSPVNKATVVDEKKDNISSKENSKVRKEVSNTSSAKNEAEKDEDEDESADDAKIPSSLQQALSRSIFKSPTSEGQPSKPKSKSTSEPKPAKKSSKPSKPSGKSSKRSK